MAVVSVSFDGTRLNAAESNTNWSNLGGGGPAPAAEPQLRYQGSNAVNRKVTSTTAREGVAYTHGSTVNMTLAANKLWFVKGYVADFGDLNATYGVELRLGNDASNYYHYNAAGSGANRTPIFSAYPSQGGYLILALDPNIASWREGTVGTPDLTAVDYFGFASQFVTGGAKSENLAMDAVDIGTGLSLVGGDGVDTDGAFSDFVDADQGTNSNRWGVVQSKAGAVVALGLLTIGTATAVGFTDNDAVVIFPDGYHSAGLLGVLCDIQNASSAIDVGATIIGNGSATTADTRPDFVVSGTAGTFAFSGTLINHRNVTLTSVCAVDGAVIGCRLLTQASADIENSTIVTDAPTSVACLQDPTFGSTTDLHDCTFEQGGVGHALEISAEGSYDFNNLVFNGYGATGQDDAAIDVTAASGTVTINVIGGTTPTYKTAGATVDIVVNPVTLSIHVQDIDDSSAMSGARVLATAASGGPNPYQESVSLTRSGGTVTVSHTAHGLATDDWVVIAGANEGEYNGVWQITVSDDNTYTYTISTTPASPATGSPTSTLAIIQGLTDVNGDISDTRTYSSDQPFEGRVRERDTDPPYKTQPFSGTIDASSGVSVTVGMIKD